MRPRHVMILLLLAVIPIGLAIVLAGGGGTRTVSGVPRASVSLALIGSSRGGDAMVCGASRHYAVYPAGSTIHFQGTISKAAAWKVKVKLKACRAGAFQAAGEASTTLPSKTTYTGSFAAPIAGYYFARADLEQGGVRVGRSDKAYFEIH
jgi:hypothetical protein